MKASSMTMALVLLSCFMESKLVAQVTDTSQSIQVTQTDSIVLGWLSTWPKLARYDFDGYHLFVYSELPLIDFDAVRGKLNYKSGFGKVQITVLSESFLITPGSQEPGHRTIELRTQSGRRFEFGSYLCIPNDGFVYSIDRPSFTNIAISRKFKYENSSFIEIEQPFYSSAMETTTNARIVIFRDLDLVEKVATLESGTKVSVIGFWAKPEGIYLSNEPYFLLRTPGGLVGWHKVAITGRNGPSSIYSLSAVESD